MFAMLMLELACNNGSSSDSSNSSDTKAGIYDGLSPEDAVVLWEQRNGKPKINVVTINGIEVRGKRRQGFGLLGKS